jgi:hypothetical protein
MGFPALDNSTNPPDPIRKGVWVHLVMENGVHQRAVISEVFGNSEEVILQIDDPTRTYGRYTTNAPHDESKTVGTWHFIEG